MHHNWICWKKATVWARQPKFCQRYSYKKNLKTHAVLATNTLECVHREQGSYRRTWQDQMGTGRGSPLDPCLDRKETGQADDSCTVAA